MKAFLRCLMLIAALCVAWATNAQSLADYTYTTGTDASKWIALNAYTDVTDGAASADGWASSVINIGFSFPFGDESYTQYSVNSDGNLRLGSTATGTSGYSTPFSSSNSNTNSPKINFLGCDGYLASGTHYVHSQIIGTDMLVVEFCMGTYNQTTRNNLYKWQVHLFSNGNIEVVMGEAPAAAPNATNQKGLCASAEDGWIIGSDNVATHFTNGSSTTWASGSWPTAYTYYTFTRPIYTCPRPTALTATAQSSNSGFISWTRGDASQNNFVVAYGTGTDPETMATVSSTSNYIALVGLNSLTTYNVFVKAVCSDNDQSNWSRMASFTTLYDCGAGYALKTAAIGNGTSTSSSYAFYSSTTYPIGSTTAIFTAEEIADAQLFENSTLNNIRLHVGSTGGTINDVHIYAKNVNKSTFDATGDTIPVTEMTEVFSGDITAVAQEWINLPLTTPFAYNQDSNLMLTFRRNGAASAAVSFYYTSTSPNYLNIYGYRSATGSTISANRTYNRPNVELQFCSEIPDCLPIYEIVNNTVTNSSATVTWTPTDTSVHNYEVAYGIVNDIAQMTTINATSPSTTLTGLSANTTYYVRVRALCSATSESSWSRAISFHTECTVADSAIFFENFDSYTGNDIPDCWHQGWYFQNTASGVKTQPFLTSTTLKYGSTGRSMSLQDQGTGTLSYLSTQCLPIDRANKYAVSLQVYRGSYSQLKPNEGIKIWASPSANDTIGATLIGYIHRQYTLEPAEESIGWHQYEFPIPQAGNQYILIEGISEYGAATYFDNLEVKELPCIKNIPYTNDFEADEVNMVPLCWDNSASTSSSLNNNPQYLWGVYNYNGNNMIRMYNYLARSGDAIINTNPFILPDTACELKLDISNRANCDPAEILISSDGGNHFDFIEEVSLIGTTHNSDPGTFVPKSYNLSEYAGDTIIIRFNAPANYGSGAIFIDNLQIRPINNCIEPTDVTAAIASTNSITVSWTAGDTTQNTFAVAYGTGNDPETMDTIIVSGTTTAVVSGLTFEQNYNFYVKAICDETHSSYWSYPASAYLGYCIPAPTTVDGNGIINVTFGCNDEIVSNSQRPTSAPHYGNYTAMIGAATAADYVNVDITYATGYTYGTIIWVDWNNNLVFDGNEVVYAGTSSEVNPTTLNTSFLIPAAQDTGYYRMRIAGSDSYYDSYTGSIETAANADPCPNSSFTIVHDYTLHVLPAPSCLRPINVVASNITDNSVDISWSLLDTTQSNFVVAYGTGLNPDEMTTTITTSTSTTLTGLTNATTYNVFVKAICSSDDESEWSNVCTFTTNTCSEENQCPVYISMADSYGDGWNGGALAVVDAAANTVMATFALSDGDYGTDSIFICKGRNYNLVWLAGPYDDEVSFVLTGANGDTIYEADEPNPGFLTTFTGSCPITDSNVYVVFAVNNGWMGSTTPAIGEYTYHIGDIINATATANPGYEFVNWSVNVYGLSNNVIVGNPYTDVIPELYAGMHVTITANFQAETFDVTALSNDNNLGIVTGSGSYNNGDIATLIATPSLGCRFVQWNDGDTNATRTLVVTSDTTLTATFEYLPVNVVLAINNSWMGNTMPAPGAYTYHVGDTVSVNATANAGFAFTSWTISNGVLSNTDVNNPLQVVIPATFAGSSIEVTANFDYDQFTITALSSDTLLGTVTGSGTYNNGANATLVATPAFGCRFVQWNDGDTNATRTVVVTSDSTFTATFEYLPINVVLAINNSWMGNTMPAPGAYTYHVGDTVIANATANEHYHFVNWTISNGAMSYDIDINPAFFTVPAMMAGMNINVTANFAVDQYTITVQSNPENMGTVLGSGSFNYGATDTLVAIANRNTRFVNWSDGDTNATRVITVTGNATYTANFEYRPITINLATNDTMMGTTYQAPGTYTFAVNDTLNVVAVANFGNHFDFWTIDYGNIMDTVVANPLEFILSNHMAGETITVTACYSIIQHTITAVPNNAALGTVTGGGIYNHGTSAVLAATPAENAHFVNWNDGDTNAIRTIVVYGDQNFVANFAYDPLTITFAVNDETMGTTDPAGIQTYQVGSTVTATAFANYGYRFVNWTISSMGVDTTFDNINFNVDNTLAGMNATITANFEVRPYHTLTLNVQDVNGNANVGGTVTGSGDFFEGESVTITATPDQYFEFIGWVNANGDIVYASSTKTFVMGTSDVELTAVFAYVEAFLDVTVNNEEMGYILINGERSNHYDGHVNDNVEITAVANEGYRFLMWIPSVGNNSNNLSYTLDNPICAINAVFAKNLDITDIVDSYVIFSENGNIVIRGAEQQTIRVFDVVGRLIEQRNDSNTEEVIPMDNTGIYLIQVGDAPARRVVVRR